MVYERLDWRITTRERSETDQVTTPKGRQGSRVCHRCRTTVVSWKRRHERDECYKEERLEELIPEMNLQWKDYSEGVRGNTFQHWVRGWVESLGKVP